MPPRFPEIDPEATRAELGVGDQEPDDDVFAAWERLSRLDNASPETMRNARRVTGADPRS